MRKCMVKILSKKTDSARNWNTLLIKEAFSIKLKKTVFNSGLKALKEIQLSIEIVWRLVPLFSLPWF